MQVLLVALLGKMRMSSLDDAGDSIQEEEKIPPETIAVSRTVCQVIIKFL